MLAASLLTRAATQVSVTGEKGAGCPVAATPPRRMLPPGTRSRRMAPALVLIDGQGWIDERLAGQECRGETGAAFDEQKALERKAARC